MTQHLYRLLLFLILILFAASCGVVRHSTSPAAESPRDSEELREIETGIASWYGSKFHGKATANGETYNMNDLTAAHRSLPFNTVVQVENQTNGKSVVVRINDRGPYVGNRIIDLSRRAAQEIDMEDAGTAEVRIFLIEEGDRPLSADNLNSIETFTVQLAAYQTRREAENFSSGISGTRVESVPVAGQTVYRVYYGTFDTPDEARTAMERLRRQGIDGFVKQTQN
jgi:rare lipoprotein A